MISIEQALTIHRTLIEWYGGADGIRDQGQLESALARPFQTFDGQELYPDPIAKACALLESVLINHPFVDGNKRTAYTLFRLLLLRNGVDFIATQNEKYTMVIAVASGELRFAELLEMVKQKVSNVG